MIRCSAACPSLTDSIFVVSNSSDLLLITRTESTWAAKDVKLPNTADVMSVEWLTPRVVIAGMNNSLVQFFDLRSQDTVSRLQHPHGVYKIRKVDEWRIVMAGAKKNLHMYDLRYASSGIARHPQPNKPNHTSTKPYISFHEYENDHISHDELDVSPEIGLLACTSPSKRIQLFSLSTGKLIMPPPLVSSHSSCLSSTPNTPLSIPSSRIQLQAHQGGVAEVPNPNRADTPITYYQYQDPITCLRFENLKEVPTANGAGNTGKPSLLVSAGNIVEEWRM
ncbi:WD-40 repeat-containing protein [Histoplasma capsulatum var. duboisii H88]|nr:WD-40 repeat-containing protein [Histoplasma capsulatum var. duboisii H88]